MTESILTPRQQAILDRARQIEADLRVMYPRPKQYLGVPEIAEALHAVAGFKGSQAVAERWLRRGRLHDGYGKPLKHNPKEEWRMPIDALAINLAQISQKRTDITVSHMRNPSKMSFWIATPDVTVPDGVEILDLTDPAEDPKDEIAPDPMLPLFLANLREEIACRQAAADRAVLSALVRD